MFGLNGLFMLAYSVMQFIAGLTLPESTDELANGAGLVIVGGPLLAAVMLWSLLSKARSDSTEPTETNQILQEQIMERQRAEASLRQSEDLYRTLAENLPHTAILLFDQDLRYSLTAGAALVRHGFSKEDMEGRTISEALSPEDREALEPYHRAALAGIENITLWRRDNRVYRLHTLPVKNERAEIFAGMAVLQDITERRRAEEERDRFFMLSLDILTIAGFDGYLKQVNPAWEEILGFTRQELLAKPYLELVHPVDQAAMADELQKLATGLDTVSFEVRLRCVNESYRWISWNITPFVAEGLWFGVGRDITGRKQSERALREAHDELELRVKERTAELKAANEELRTFTYIVSHDLRAPLVNLKGFTTELRLAIQVIQSALDAVLPHLAEPQRAALSTALSEDIPEALSFIASSVTSMDNLTNAVLKLSRLGHRQLEFEPIEMNALVQTTLKILAHQIEQRHAKVTVGQLPEVIADRVAMEQIMANILTNAVVYLDSSRPGEVEITAERTFNEAIFYIRDNGRGIAPDDMHKVFEPFRRAGKPDVPGEGMGLSYVQTLVRRHGGRIECQSELGVGTTFIFTIANNPTIRR